MNRILLFCCCMFSLPALAQCSLFLRPEFGVGVGDAKTKYSNGINDNSTHQFVFVTNETIGVGISCHHFFVNTGIGYATSGVGNIEAEIYIPSGQYAPEQYIFKHIMVPLSVSYNIKLGKIARIQPGVGLIYSYNTSVYLQNQPGNEPRTATISGDDFKSAFSTSSLWGMYRLQVGLKANRVFTLVLGPEYRFMLSNILSNRFSNSGTAIYNNTFTFNLGGIFTL